MRALESPRESVQAVYTPTRWFAVSVFALFSTLNYIDRQLLAAAGPALKAEFSLSNEQYGLILSAFSLAYMFVTPLAGLLIDRVGLNLSAMLSVAAWSLSGMTTGFARTFQGVLFSRMGLGVAEAAGIPCASKCSATYLEPKELGLGDAVHALGITAGAIAAPLLFAAVAPLYGWRSAFVLAGAAGLLWIPLWWLVSTRVQGPAVERNRPALPTFRVFIESRIWMLIGANVLIMVMYSLWMNWTTIYFVQGRHLTQTQANQYFAWIPPIFATLGGFFGGYLAFNRIRRGNQPLPARLSVCYIGAPLTLSAALVPFLPTPLLAAGAISLSFFGLMTILTNLHVMPIDIFGPKHAAFTASLLTCSYALMQVFISPTVGGMVDRFGFGAVFVTISVLPTIGVLIIRAAVSRLRPALMTA